MNHIDGPFVYMRGASVCAHLSLRLPPIDDNWIHYLFVLGDLLPHFAPA